MSRRPLTEDEMNDLEWKVGQVLLDVQTSEGEFDIENEFKELMFSDGRRREDVYEEIRVMTKRFGPRLMNLLGFPPANGGVRIQVIENGMAAAIHIDPPTADGAPVSVEDVHRKLEEQKIIFGIDEIEIKNAVELGRAGQVRALCIARGNSAQLGRDGFIHPIKGTENEVDLPRLSANELQIRISEIESVNKDQKIARLVAPTTGTPGCDVFGTEVSAPAGKPIVPLVGENVAFDAHAGFFFAKSPGRPVIQENRIDIENLLCFNKDVDISVGHVLFPGELMIRGWVRSGLTVQADKDIVIENGVEAASVRSVNGSVFIGKGVQGAGRGMIQAAWDITVKFAEHATLVAGGVLRARSSVNCELAGGEAVVVAEGKGTIIGGRIYAGDRVEARELGAGTGGATVVQLGVTPQQLMLLTQLKSRLQVAQKALYDAEEALARVGLTPETLQTESVTAEGRQLLKLAKTVLVLHNRSGKIQEEETSFLESMKARTHGEVVVRGRVYPGVKILIGHASHVVTETLSWVRFKYDPDHRRIKAVPLI